MISYCSEKTTEFSLVPTFSSLLNELGENVPIQYWKTREGNKTSDTIHGSEPVLLVALFARRPKVKVGKKRVVQGKINSYVFEFNDLAKKYEVPVFCGMPIAQNLFEMYSSEKIWFHIYPNAQKYQEVIFNLTNCGNVDTNSVSHDVEQVRYENIVDVIRKRCSPMTWSQAIDIMSELNRKPGTGHWFTRTWYYKPIYFIIKQKP
ncbi:hypothetical protein [Vibrio atlanticus]|uniref:hypothetical protein n=1 Tax=Vibrio atlanticus TaxID=693153 RepID=UPI003D110E4D